MKLNWYLGVLAIGSMAVMNACSGLGDKGGGGCTTNCGGGTTNLTISLYDTPPMGTSVLDFVLPITGISLSPSSGSNVNVPVTVSSPEVTRLQTDSTVIVDQSPIAAGSYTSINVTVGPSSATGNLFLNTSGGPITSGTTSCLNNQLCDLPVGAAYTISIPIALTLTSNGNQWIGLDLNLNNIITTPSINTIGVDFSRTGAMTATTTPRTNITAGVDLVDDYTGMVTAVNSSSITVQSGIAGTSLTASITSATEVNVAPTAYSQSQCSGTGTLSCVLVGSTVSLDTVLASDGSFTATEIDVLDSVAVDEVEGIILPYNNGGSVGIQMVLEDKWAATSSALTSATYGANVLLTPSTSPTYSIDYKTLSSVSGSITGFSGSGSLLAGQVVRAQLSNISTDTSGDITATAVNVLLRWSRLTGTVNTVASPTFTAASLPSYIYTLNPTLSTTPQVNTFTNLTEFVGTTGVAELQPQATVSYRALFLTAPSTYPFQAAKVLVP